MNENDLIFYQRRLDEERARERDAVTPQVASAHRLLAHMYAQPLDEIGSSPAEIFLLKGEKSAADESQKKQRRKLSLRS